MSLEEAEKRIEDFGVVIRNSSLAHNKEGESEAGGSDWLMDKGDLHLRLGLSGNTGTLTGSISGLSFFMSPSQFRSPFH